MLRRIVNKLRTDGVRGLVAALRRRCSAPVNRLRAALRACGHKFTSGCCRLLTRAAILLLWLLTYRDRGRPARRSLWAGTPILTLPVKAKGERRLGVEADSLVFETYFITEGFKYNLQPYMKGSARRQNLIRHLVLFWACLKYQRFHFFCDRGLLAPQGRLRFNESELALYRYLGKEVFFYAYGADVRTEARTRALGTPNLCVECPGIGTSCVCYEEVGRSNQEVLTQHATAIFSLGDMIAYTPGSRNDLFYWPLDLDADQRRRYAPRYPDPEGERPIRVVHAPNHRHLKGSHYLFDAVEKLQAEGLLIELVLVERVPNREALEIYRTADIVFDQCVAGFHGYFALEALAMGKPVMVYIRDRQQYLLDPDACPFVDCTPDTMVEVLRELAQDRGRLHDLGRRGRQYIERHYTVDAFAGRLRQAYIDLKLPGFDGEAPAKDQPRRAAA